ncbi:MAG: YncE family protein, partial [Thaumarchaeota archaeon]|nr:YncE family protein [Nitrososphaerota archaeon]
MSEFKLSILRNIGVAALIFTTVFSLSLYASSNIAGGAVSTTITNSTSSTVNQTALSTTTVFGTTIMNTSNANATTVNSTLTSETYCKSNVTATGTASNTYEQLPAGSILHSITTNVSNGGIAFDPQTNRLYVAGSNYFDLGVAVGSASNAVYEIDGATFQLINATIPVGGVPVDIAYDGANGYLYTANIASNTVSVVDPATNTVIKNITVGSNPIRVAYDPANKEIYVSNRGSGTVSAINSTTNAVVATINVGGSPFDFAYDPMNHDMYVADGGAGTVSVINSSSNQVSEQMAVNLEASPGVGTMIAYDASNNYIYLASFGS